MAYGIFVLLSAIAVLNSIRTGEEIDYLTSAVAVISALGRSYFYSPVWF